MTVPDIIEIAKKAAAEVREDADGLAYVGFYPRSFDRFAALYREALIASGEVVEWEKVEAERERWRQRKNWIAENSGDHVALHFALHAPDKEFDEAMVEESARSQP